MYKYSISHTMHMWSKNFGRYFLKYWSKKCTNAKKSNLLYHSARVLVNDEQKDLVGISLKTAQLKGTFYPSSNRSCFNSRIIGLLSVYEKALIQALIVTLYMLKSQTEK